MKQSKTKEHYEAIDNYIKTHGGSVIDASRRTGAKMSGYFWYRKHVLDVAEKPKRKYTKRTPAMITIPIVEQPKMVAIIGSRDEVLAAIREYVR